MKAMYVVLAAVAIIALVLIVGYNDLVGKDENVMNSWAQVQNTYQRRADLAQQLVDAVNAEMAQELEIFVTLQEQAAALAASQASVPDTEADAAALEARYAAFDQALINAIAYTADNPDIVSADLMENLMIQVEGSENRVAVARRDYNNAVTAYRNATRRFPGSLLAGAFGFETDAYALFEASEGAQNAPNLEFDKPGDDN